MGSIFSFDPLVAGVGTHLITYTPKGNCSTSAMTEVLVLEPPSISFTLSAEMCFNDEPIILSGGMPIGGVYSGDGVEDLGDGISFLFNPYDAGTGQHQVSYSYTDEQGCTGEAYSQGDGIFVHNLSPVSLDMPEPVCEDAGLIFELSYGWPEGGVYSGTGVHDDGNGQSYTLNPEMAGVGLHFLHYTLVNTHGCESQITTVFEVVESIDPFCLYMNDADQDGVDDDEDNCWLTPNPEQLDYDDDGWGDACDNCFRHPNPGQEDADMDEVGDICDKCPFIPFDSQHDPDKDGLGDECDNCPNVKNSYQGDADNDGVGNACDNCIYDANPDQLDLNGNGIGDICETISAGKPGGIVKEHRNSRFDCSRNTSISKS